MKIVECDEDVNISLEIVRSPLNFGLTKNDFFEFLSSLQLTFVLENQNLKNEIWSMFTSQGKEEMLV